MPRLPARPQLHRALQKPTRLHTRAQHTAPPSSPTSASINAEEVSHFEALAAEWWSPHGPSHMLHTMNPHRHAFIAACRSAQPDAAPALPNILTYLDVGCGGGIFAESAARLPSTRRVTAVDPTAQLIEVARQHARRDPAILAQGKLTYLNQAVEELPVGEAHDVVSVWEVIEHVNDPAVFLGQVARHVKPGGWLVLSTIARTWPSWVTTKLVAEEILRMVPRGTHDWAKYINEPELRAWFSQGAQQGQWETPRSLGLLPLPGLGWREIPIGNGHWGNYLFGVRRTRG